MKKAEAIAQLAARRDALQSRGVAAAYLFGSTARGDEGPDSDIDVFIDIVPGNRFSLLDLAGVYCFLNEEISRKVDVMTRSSLHPKLRDDIEREAVRIF